jgi:carbonic anhydrase
MNRKAASSTAPLTSSDFIGRWMSQIAPAADAVQSPKDDWESYLRQLEFASVELSLKNLMTFPFVRAAVEKGELALHGAYFGVASGKLLVRNETTGVFEPMGD